MSFWQEIEHMKFCFSLFETVSVSLNPLKDQMSNKYWERRSAWRNPQNIKISTGFSKTLYHLYFIIKHKEIENKYVSSNNEERGKLM